MSVAFQIPDKPLQVGKALSSGTRHSLTQLIHNERYVCSILTEEQTSCNLLLAELNLTQCLWLLFCCIMRCWCLHEVAVLKSEVFHKHVDMSGIVLIKNSSPSPVQPSVQRFDAL